MTAVIHDFQKSLARSQSYDNAPWWLAVYRKAFPTLQSAVSVRKDGWAQRGGIDRVLTLASGKTIAVDEKIRERDYDDILLERWSSEEDKNPGWIQKNLACDYIAYAFVPSETCYLLPTLTLQRAWRIHGRAWISKYPEIRANNRNYTTVSIPIPVTVLFEALSDAMQIHWGPA